MKRLNLNLAQILAAAWVWKNEIYPRYLFFWQKYGEKCRTCRYPDLHVKDYNTFVDQIFSTLPVEEISCTRGALSIFTSQITNLLETVCPDWKKEPGSRKVDSAVRTLALLTPETLTPAAPILEFSEQEQKKAREIIKALLTVDAAGIPDYKHCSAALTFSDSGRLQKISIRPMQIEFF